MNQLVNPSIVLDNHPQGAATTGNFRIANQPIGELKPGEFLIENTWLSMDPYTRPRLNENTAYVEPIKLGEVIQGETIGKVVESNSPKYQVGDRVFTFSGWQKYCVGNDADFMTYRLPDTELSPTIFLSVAGTPGRAAYFGLNKIAKPKAGETMVVSAASGAVGSVAGQLGKMAGCRVVGIAGSEEKCRYVVDELGFDTCVNYKSDNLGEEIEAACPNGVDIYFENVGGRISSLVARHLNEGARVPICGSAALYNKGKDVDASTLSRFYSSLPSAPENRFFLVTEWVNDYASSISWLTAAAESGQLKFRETVTEGLENAPQAFVDLLEGKHFGKQLVRV
ncbi:NADP-dependent oxidoreductase [Vibrio coralliilyticus]|uniref:NADP-dependent oxidoreductase n=1 Tax=Vibrio TaxID=662 RepID=UPI000501CDED|nr:MULTISPECIES: NADP-dependent oxidoreductase [Vibrio]KFI12864.1 2-alkenal reductase [Vibrio sp. B183]NOI17420.1 NADP-dependent oxidoreductase [Vibrio coralliilyticus]PAU37036.1 NADP-dependent oxidoreductase [Vibrio coralliilyticus]